MAKSEECVFVVQRMFASTKDYSPDGLIIIFEDTDGHVRSERMRGEEFEEKTVMTDEESHVHVSVTRKKPTFMSRNPRPRYAITKLSLKRTQSNVQTEN